jgi:hypothetical protein
MKSACTFWGVSIDEMTSARTFSFGGLHNHEFQTKSAENCDKSFLVVDQWYNVRPLIYPKGKRQKGSGDSHMSIHLHMKFEVHTDKNICSVKI